MPEPGELSRDEILAGGEAAFLHAIRTMGDVDCEERSTRELVEAVLEFVGGVSPEEWSDEEEESVLELFKSFVAKIYEGFAWFAGDVYDSEQILYWLPASKVAFAVHNFGGDPYIAEIWSQFETVEEAIAEFDLFFDEDTRPAPDIMDL